MNNPLLHKKLFRIINKLNKENFLKNQVKKFILKFDTAADLGII